MAISGIGSNYNLFEAAANYEYRKITIREAISMPEEQSVNFSLSEEGLRALRERVNEIQPKIEYTDPREMPRVETNEIEFDYYMTLRKMSGSTLGGRDYDVKDVMNSIMETYETFYNEIVDAHKDGDRLVSYEIMGDKILTLEEDLEKLDIAFKRRLGDLEGYITCRQTMGGAWLARRNSRPTPQSQQSQENQQGRVKRYDGYYYSEKEYADVAVSMVKSARENFLALIDNQSYQEGDGKRIISDMINENEYFLADTKKLYSKY